MSATHGGRLRGGGSTGAVGTGARRGAPLSDLLCSLRARPQSHRGGGAAGPVPGSGWRRARRPETRLGAPPAGSPLGAPWSEGCKPPRQVGWGTSNKPRFPGEGGESQWQDLAFSGTLPLTCFVALNKSANLSRPNLEIGVHELIQSI